MISPRAVRLVEKLHEVWDVRSRQEVVQRYLDEEHMEALGAGEPYHAVTPGPLVTFTSVRELPPDDEPEEPEDEPIARLRKFCVALALLACLPACHIPAGWIGTGGPPASPFSPPPTSSPSPTVSPSPPPPPMPATPVPTPLATPEPAPPVPGPVTTPQIDPATGNYPMPLAGNCPPWFAGSLSWVGITFTGRVDKRWNLDATPHSVPPFCPHAPGNLKCEQLTACQDPEGPDFYMTLPGVFKDEVCDKFSNNPYKCHHVPEPGQTGLTTFCAVPRGARPDSRAGRCVTVNVRP